MIKISIISPEINGKYRVEGSKLTTGGNTANKTFSSDLFRPLFAYIIIYMGNQGSQGSFHNKKNDTVNFVHSSSGYPSWNADSRKPSSLQSKNRT